MTFNPNQDYEPQALSNGSVLYSSYRFYAQDGSPGPVRGERFLQRIETHCAPCGPTAAATTTSTVPCEAPSTRLSVPRPTAFNTRANIPGATWWACR